MREQQMGKAWEGNCGASWRQVQAVCLSLACQAREPWLSLCSCCIWVQGGLAPGPCGLCAGLSPGPGGLGFGSACPGVPSEVPCVMHQAGAAAALTIVAVASSEAANLAPHVNPCLVLLLWVVAAGLWASVASSVNRVPCFSERPCDSEGVMATGGQARAQVCAPSPH